MIETYIAHINGERKQSVEAHLRNTAKIALDHNYSIAFGAVIELACLLHDMGKLCGDFNSYIHGQSDKKRGEIDHCYAGAKYILSLADDSDRSAAEFVARVIVSHHGLHDWVKEDGADYLRERTAKDTNYSEIFGNYEAIFPRKDTVLLLKKAAHELADIKRKIGKICFGKQKCKQAAFYMGMLERLVVSVLIDADRTDTADFMADREAISENNTDEIWEAMHRNIQRKCAVFSKMTDEISVARSDISNRCAAFAEHRVGICRLVVPTGGGKTLSSMRFVAEYSLRYGNRRIIYTAPFMSILEQNSDVIRSLVGNDDQYLEHHSNFLQEIDDENEVQLYQYHSEKWDSAVISTTLVQLLNTLFLSKTSSVRRFHRLCNSVIIVDEVQSVPVRCVRLFNMAMNFLSKICGSTVVLCSATQPPFEKDEQYPLLLDELHSMTGDHTADFERFRRTQLTDSRRKQGYSFGETADFCFERFRENGNVLLIVNTKKAAEAVYQELKERVSEDTLLLHISTKMCPQHRRDTLNSLREALEKNRPVICVTTQLIEAGVDISFRCVVRSMAGLDNIAQAAGRCNRSGEYGLSDVYVINICDEVLGQLKEIKLAQAATTNALYHCDDIDMLKSDIMEIYYRALFSERQNELSYPAEDISVKTDLVDMLSVSTVRCAQKVERRAGIYQCPKTAGEIFKVIDNNTRSVIVPYNDEAKELIVQLTSEIPQHLITDVLRKAQKYTVELYAPDEMKLNDEGALYSTAYGLSVLSAEHYSSEYGVTLENGIKEVLIF